MANVLVIGAGAVGSFFAGQLFRAGLRVTLLARGSRMEDLRKNGLILDRGEGLETLPVAACDWAHIPQEADFTLLALKTCQLEEALDRLATAPAGARQNVVTLQNGIDAPELCRAKLPKSRILAARMHGFVEIEGKVTRHVGVPVSLAFGTWRAQTGSQTEKALDDLRKLLDAASIGARVAPDIERQLWEKFILASALGTTAAALDMPAGLVAQNEGAAGLLRSAMEEVVLLARSRQISLPSDIVQRTLAFAQSFPPDATTSLQRDLSAGRASEYAALTGAVLRIAREEDLPAITFERLDAMIRARGLDPD